MPLRRPNRQGRQYMPSSQDSERRLHPKAQEAFELMERGRLSRREFIRVAALTGLAAGAAYAMAGLPAAGARAGQQYAVHGRSQRPEGRHPARRHGNPEDGGSGELRLDADVERQPADARIHLLHRPAERHPSDAGGELGSFRRPEDLDAPSSPGREVVERRRFQRRRRDLQLHPLDGPRGRLVQRRPLDLRRDASRRSIPARRTTTARRR